MSRCLPIVLVILLVAAEVHAQPRWGGAAGRDEIWRLLDLPEVQKELRLKDQQLDFLNDLRADLSDQRRGALLRGGRRSDENRRARFEEVRRTLRLQGEALVAVVLEPEQTKRLFELQLQSEGARAFDRDEFVESLALSDQQVEKIRAVRQAALQPPSAAANSTARQRQAKIEADIQALLTDEQNEKWRAMKGQPFRFPSNYGNFGGRRFGDSSPRPSGPSDSPP